MKTLTANTHIAKVRELDRQMKKQICNMLNWTDQQYCEHQFNVYLAFLKRRFFGQPQSVLDRVCYDGTIRGYFNNEWCHRNLTDYLPFALDNTKHSKSDVSPNGALFLCFDYSPLIDFLTDEYLYVHSIYELINDSRFMAGFDNILKQVLH